MKKIMAIRIQVDDEDLIPKYATPGSSGVDLVSAEDCVINHNQITIVNTGIKLEISEGYEGQVRPRSGLAAKEGITVVNSPGTIDSDYRGYIKVILFKMTPGSFIIKKGDRIAQLVFAPVVKAHFKIEMLSNTERSEGGFGSTGI